MAERSGVELSDMLQRIPDSVLGAEFKKFVAGRVDITEVRDVVQTFLEYYVRGPRNDG